MTLTRGSWEAKKVCAVSSVTGVIEYIALGSSERPHVLAFSLPIRLASSELDGVQTTYASIPSESFSDLDLNLQKNPKPQHICPAAKGALWNLSASFPERPDMQPLRSPFHSQGHFCSANICPTEEWHMESWEVNPALLQGRIAIYWWFKCFPPGNGWLSTSSRGKTHWFNRSSGKQFFPIQKNIPMFLPVENLTHLKLLYPILIKVYSDKYTRYSVND